MHHFDTTNRDSVIAIFESVSSGNSHNAYGGRISKVGNHLWLALRIPEGQYLAVVRLYRTRTDARRFLREGALMFDVLHYLEIRGGRDSKGVVSIAPDKAPEVGETDAAFVASVLASIAIQTLYSSKPRVMEAA